MARNRFVLKSIHFFFLLTQTFKKGLGLIQSKDSVQSTIMGDGRESYKMNKINKQKIFQSNNDNFYFYFY